MGMFLGDSTKLLEIMNMDFPELGMNKTECLEMKWIESVLFWLSIPPGTVPTSVMLNRIPQKQIYLKRKSDYVQKQISRTSLDAIFKVLLENENITMAWNSYGGRMSEIPSTETAFPQ
ncbi:FAD-binding Berberine family protein [Raphanus sativus]|nr:FAD-binding Berberine family protein [Raphanus sativus]